MDESKNALAGGEPAVAQQSKGKKAVPHDTPPSAIRLPLAAITTDPQIQQRAGGVSADLVAEYAEEIASWIDSAPVDVFHDADMRIVADGFHRVHAALEAGLDDIPVRLHQGDRRAALLFAVAANATHGARRTAADKRRAVETLLSDPEWSQWSDRMIAERVGVSPTTVGTIRAQLSKLDSCEPANVVEGGEVDQPANWKNLPVDRPANWGNSPVEPPMEETEEKRETAPTRARSYSGAFPENAARFPSQGIDDAEIIDDAAAEVIPATQPAQEPPKRIGRDGKARTAPTPRTPAPPKPRAKDALHRALAVTAALAELGRVATAIIPNDPAFVAMVRGLEDAVALYRPLIDGRGVDHA